MKKVLGTLIAIALALMVMTGTVSAHEGEHKDWGESGTPGYSVLKNAPSSGSASGWIECSTDAEFAARNAAWADRSYSTKWDIGPARCKDHAPVAPVLDLSEVLPFEAADCDAYAAVKEAVENGGDLELKVGDVSVTVKVDSLPVIEDCEV